MDESETAHGEEVNTGLGASVGKCGQEPTCRNLQGVSHVRVRALIIVRVPKHNSPGETRESPAAGVEQSKGGEHGRRTPFPPGLYPDGPAQGPEPCGASGGNLGARRGGGGGAGKVLPEHQTMETATSAISKKSIGFPTIIRGNQP